jgi:DNA-directed RNA polymerase II subunit RPB2
VYVFQVCPAETPEGHACGLVKNLSLMAYITVGNSPELVINFLNDEGMESLEDIGPGLIPHVTKVL